MCVGTHRPIGGSGRNGTIGNMDAAAVSESTLDLFQSTSRAAYAVAEADFVGPYFWAALRTILRADLLAGNALAVEVELVLGGRRALRLSSSHHG